MKHQSILRIPAAAAILTLGACSYPDYHGGSSVSRYPASNVRSSVSGAYSYSGGGGSTSVFISTGDPLWGYDPYYHSYYNYSSRRYYDPWLMGYYPLGYRPQIIIGAPHPHGWHSGRKFCPPPRHVRNHTLKNHQHRDVAYRRLGHSWSKDIRVRDSGYSRQNVCDSAGRHPRTSHTPSTTSRTPYRSDPKTGRDNPRIGYSDRNERDFQKTSNGSRYPTSSRGVQSSRDQRHDQVPPTGGIIQGRQPTTPSTTRQWSGSGRMTEDRRHGSRDPITRQQEPNHRTSERVTERPTERDRQMATPRQQPRQQMHITDRFKASAEHSRSQRQMTRQQNREETDTRRKGR